VLSFGRSSNRKLFCESFYILLYFWKKCILIELIYEPHLLCTFEDVLLLKFDIFFYFVFLFFLFFSQTYLKLDMLEKIPL
jgi:hypothetical protein